MPHKTIYWITTAWLALGMLSTGVVQVMQIDDEAARFNKLGYPAYLMILVGIWKFFGVVAVLLPKLPLLKEWAYAGFFFLMSGAIVSHLATSNAASELFGPTLLLVLTSISWYFRPIERKLNP